MEYLLLLSESDPGLPTLWLLPPALHPNVAHVSAQVSTLQSTGLFFHCRYLLPCNNHTNTHVVHVSQQDLIPTKPKMLNKLKSNKFFLINLVRSLVFQLTIFKHHQLMSYCTRVKMFEFRKYGLCTAKVGSGFFCYISQIRIRSNHQIPL
jgi:hypothetical protein